MNSANTVVPPFIMLASVRFLPSHPSEDNEDQNNKIPIDHSFLTLDRVFSIIISVRQPD